MTARLKKWFGGLGHMNPIVIKELRQLVRSRYVVGMLMLYLLVMVSATGLYLLMEVASEFQGSQLDRTFGPGLFSTLQLILTAVCFFFIPVYTSVRLSKERGNANMDLLFITTIGAPAIVRGKLFAGLVLAALLYSVSLPFMALTYLLRGIDIPSMVIALATVFLFVACAIQGGIFVACIPARRVFHAILGLVGIGILTAIYGAMQEAIHDLIRSGAGSLLGSKAFWAGAAPFMVAAAIAFTVMFVLSVALMLPPTANRALRVRLVVTIGWLIGGLLCFGSAYVASDRDPVMAWFSASAVLLCISLMIALSEEEELSIRVRRTIPRNRLLRAGAFLLYNGPAGGLAWASVLTLLTFLVGALGVAYVPVTHPDWHNLRELWRELRTDDVLFGFFGVVGYAYAYGLGALWLHKFLLKKWMPTRAICVIAVVLMAMGAAIPSVVHVIATRFNTDTFGEHQFGNVFALTQEEFRGPYTIFAWACALCALVLSRRWFFRQTKAFKPYVCEGVPAKE